MALIGRTRQRQAEPTVLTLLGDIASEGEPPDVDEAVRRYDEALAVAADCGMRPRVATVHLALGQLLRRVNRHGEAREHLTVAAAMFREMDLRSRLAATKAALREME